MKLDVNFWCQHILFNEGDSIVVVFYFSFILFYFFLVLFILFKKILNTILTELPIEYESYTE